MIDVNDIIKNAKNIAKIIFFKDIKLLNPSQLYYCVSKAIMGEVYDNMLESRKKHLESRRAYYFSAEFLMGRMTDNNLLNLGILGDLKEQLKKEGIDLEKLEDVDDSGLGNGGLGRLAACFLDSAASNDIYLDGYGIRYKYGLFKQEIKDGYQVEKVDDWTSFSDPFSIRRDDNSVTVKFSDMKVLAVPYDMVIIGYKTSNIQTLRLWQSESFEKFDFEKFNNQDYIGALYQKNRAEDISRVLYPNDSGYEGKKLRLRQQYFFTSASIQDILKNIKNIDEIEKEISIQLNDTHPAVATLELIRLLMEDYSFSFEKALDKAKKIFNYTNHTVMQEALERWDEHLFKELLPQIYDIAFKVNEALKKELREKKVSESKINNMLIISNNQIHMANLCIYVSSYVNGVAKIHTEILKNRLLKDWYEIYKDKFQNKTNGITQRRWLGLANKDLTEFISELCGNDDFLIDLSKISKIKNFADDPSVLKRFIDIKNKNKLSLCEYIKKRENITVDPNTIFDIQIKRLHEYKRQLLNILAILELYFEIKEGSLDFYPTTFIFGAKAAPGYVRAKNIIKLINCVSDFISKDDKVSKYLKVVFATNYNVSYAQKLVAAADVSEQISTAGTEASGTGNMKLMLNGAVTLGTFDGANIEIFEKAGIENNYVFGATVETLEKIKDSYNPLSIYNSDYRVKRVIDALIDGTLSNDKSMFLDLYNSLLKGSSWQRADNYFVLYDFDDYLKAKKKINADYKNRVEFSKKCWLNIANSAYFSSDRTVKEYASDIWKI